jgi:ferredoxin
MAYVITEPCVGTLDAACAEVCPVDCIHPGPGEDGIERTTILYVDPDECIDCGACMEACPVEAPLLEADVPDRWEPYVAINRAFYEQGHAAAETLLADHLRARSGT